MILRLRFIKKLSATAATAHTWGNTITGSTLVLDRTFNTTDNFLEVKGYMPFILTNPFVYDGSALEIAVEWEFVDFVRGQGTVLKANNYIYLDTRTISNKTYYRLKQLDFDGKYEFSNVILITNENQRASTVKIYPNPVYNQLTIQGFTGRMTVYNVLGQPITKVE